LPAALGQDCKKLQKLQRLWLTKEPSTGSRVHLKRERSLYKQINTTTNKQRVSEEPRDQLRDISVRLAMIFPVHKRQDVASFISMNPNRTRFLPNI